MTRAAHFSITQVRPGVFSVRATSPEFRPGPSGSEIFVVRVEQIPDGVPGDVVAKRVAHVVDMFDPPVVVSWSELVAGDGGPGDGPR